MKKINTSGDNRDCRDKDYTQEVDCCHKCSQFPINIQQQINEYKPADQNAILSRVEVSKSNEESICTNLNCKKIIKQIMQEKEDQSHQFDQRLKIVEQERDELREKCKELEQQILEIFQETINQNQQRIKQFQKNVSSDNKMKYQNQNNKKATCDDKYLLEHQSSTKRSIQEMVQDMKNGIKKKHQMKFFDWGLRQTMGDSVSYQGSIIDNKLWDQVINDAKRGLIGNLFDVIVADAPWDSTAINLNYQTLSDSQFMTKIPIHRLQQNGYLFLWITNKKKLEVALQYLEKIGYERIELITWIKISKENLLRDNIGFYLRHFTEFCIVARKKGKFAELSKITKTYKAPNIIMEKVTESSRKPEQLIRLLSNFAQMANIQRYLEECTIKEKNGQQLGMSPQQERSLNKRKPEKSFTKQTLKALIRKSLLQFDKSFYNQQQINQFNQDSSILILN
ncbi:MT-A70 family protein [Oxytricha trifallax]|uniref:mRNA m(6)A methyltransferase n=1 Tax=Oxytricha trifallax TaxID=1172189 RepID=A0A073HZ06_9SPIT|nr:MT-A70 family protein [Oxytricha trifallax]